MIVKKTTQNIGLLAFVLGIGVVLVAISAVSASLQYEITICRNGCDFQTIQTAIESQDTKPNFVLVIKDSIHTEVGIHVSKHVIIQGNDGKQPIIQAHAEARKATDRVFIIEKGVEAAFQNLIIQHGKPKGYPASGGGIANQGNLMLDNVVVTENDAYTSGGGIWNKGTLRIINSHITKNRAHRAGPHGEACGSGGGIQNERDGQLFIENSTISNNHSDSRGGGLFLSCTTKAEIKNSVISYNRSRKEGGGISVMGELHISGSQVIHNSVGGIANFGKLVISGNIVSDNQGVSDCSNFCKLGKCGVVIQNSNNRIGKPGAGF